MLAARNVTTMGSPELTDLSAGVWGIAAVAACAELGIVERLGEPTGAEPLAAEAGVSPQVAGRLLDMLVALGLAERRGTHYVATRALAERSPAMLAADGTATVLAAADLVRRAAERDLGDGGWRHTDPVVLQAQGTMSAGAVAFLERFVFPNTPGIPERLASGATFLDVGAGVAAVSIELCRRFPRLRVVALEPAEAPLALGRANVAAAGLEKRIELRRLLVQDLDDVEAFDIAWLPVNFLPAPDVPAALERVHRALRPRGLLLSGTLGGGGGDIRAAAGRLRSVLWGGDAMTPDRVVTLLEAAGFTDIATADRMASSLVPVTARR
jgi:SAM-dependent methyltransferase